MLESNIKKAEALFEKIKSENIRFIDLQFTDVPGRLQHVTVSTSSLSPDDLLNGIPKLDGSSIKGFTEIYESDMLLVPDLDTFSILPWYKDYKVARMLCNVYSDYGNEEFSKDPRYVAKRAEEYLKEIGIGTSFWGPEVEFFVFDGITIDASIPSRGQSYSITSKEAPWSREATNYAIRFKEGYFPVPPQDTLMDYRNEVVGIMEDYFGISCEAHHHEVATAGQCEIDMVRDKLTKMADNVMTLKYVAKNVAHRKNLIATFLPKPIFGDNGSGMHVHVSLWSGGSYNDPPTVLKSLQFYNLFYDPSDEYAELSQTGRYFVGGLLEHSRALAAIVAPTTNSYRRLVAGYEAPIYIAWSKGNRSANVRIPVYQKGEKYASKKRVEFRTPDPSCNPYLCFASILAAGLDGIKKKIDPGDPVDENIYLLTPEKRKQLGIKELPTSLKEAVESLKSDNEFLKPIFSQELIDTIIEIEISQHNQVSAMPHPYEFYLYLDV